MTRAKSKQTNQGDPIAVLVRKQMQTEFELNNWLNIVLAKQKHVATHVINYWFNVYVRGLHELYHLVNSLLFDMLTTSTKFWESWPETSMSQVKIQGAWINIQTYFWMIFQCLTYIFE